MLKCTILINLKKCHARGWQLHFVNKPLRVLQTKDKSGINIIGIKISGAKYVFNPSPDLTLSRGDQLFVLGSPVQISEFRELLENQK